MDAGSLEGRCPRCGAPATCSPSKGWWCAYCRNGSRRLTAMQQAGLPTAATTTRPGCRQQQRWGGLTRTR